ncbi:MAG: T9SS type A sorting domain-containing protein [Bacteroidota bacterium]
MKKIILSVLFFWGSLFVVAQSSNPFHHIRMKELSSLQDISSETLQDQTPGLRGMTDLGDPPSLNWVKRFGGEGPAVGMDMITDASGNSYVCGYFSGLVNFGTTALTSIGSVDAFIAKYSNSGILTWVKQMSCDVYEMAQCKGITLDASSNVIVIGWYNGSILNAGTATFPRTGYEDIFFAKFNAVGDFLMGGHYGIAGMVKQAKSIATDVDGNIFVVGGGENISFGGGNSFIKFDPAGNFLWDFSNGALFHDVAINNNVNPSAIYLTGYLNSSVNFGATTLTGSTSMNAPFLAKCNPSGNFSWAVQGVPSGTGSAYDRATALAVDGNGNIYFSGRFRKNLSFGSLSLINLSNDHTPFVVKCDASGTFVWARKADVWYNSYYSTYNQPVFITLDGAGNPYISCNLLNDSLVFGGYKVGGSHWCMAKYSANGNEQWALTKDATINGMSGTAGSKILYAGSLGNNAVIVQNNAAGTEEWRVQTSGNAGAARISNLELDHGGNLYCYGRTDIPDPMFGTTTGTFLAKMKPGGEEIWSLPIEGFVYGNNNEGYGNYITSDQEDNIIILGNFTHSVTINTLTLINPGNFDAAFMAKIDPSGNVIWLRQVGNGQTYSDGYCVETDNENNIVTSGVFYGSFTIGDFILVSSGDQDVFVAKYDKNGDVQWAKRAGGETIEYISFVSTDSLKNIYLTGEFVSRNITIDNYPLPLTESDGDVVLVKFTPSGDVSWAFAYGGDPTPGSFQRTWCWPTAIKTNSAGDNYIYGWTGNHNYYGPYLLESPYNTENLFLTKINNSGIVQWAKIIKEKGQNWHSLQIDLDKTGNCYIGGNIRDTTWFDINPVMGQGRYDLFLARYDQEGRFNWAKIFGSNPLNLYENYLGMNNLWGIAVYDSSSIYTGGSFSNDLQLDATTLHSSGLNGFLSLLGNNVPVVPARRELINITVDNDITKCFNASETITVAGNGTFFRVQNGGDVTLIAGGSIMFRSGTNVQTGGHLWGYITTSGDYCGLTLNPLVTNPSGEEKDLLSVSESKTGFIKVYPNPTTGNFTLELTGEVREEKVKVDVYGMQGEKVFSSVVNSERNQSFSLSNRQAGIYFIRVITGDKAETLKIIKQ